MHLSCPRETETGLSTKEKKIQMKNSDLDQQQTKSPTTSLLPKEEAKNKVKTPLLKPAFICHKEHNSHLVLSREFKISFVGIKEQTGKPAQQDELKL